MAKKYESPMSRLTQQFAHAVDWADGHDDRVEQLRQAMQSAVEGKFASTGPALGWNPPSWWTTPEQQVERARSIWGNLSFPSVPEFVPQTMTEVLLLHVPRPFDELWNVVVAPAGYTTYRTDLVKSDAKHLRLAPNVHEWTDLVWLGFDPEHGKGIAPDKLWGQSNLAASEGLSGLVQFRDWSLAWFNGASAPNLAGYQSCYDGSWSRVPYLNRWDGDHQLGLGANWADGAVDDWASPSVRRVQN